MEKRKLIVGLCLFVIVAPAVLAAYENGEISKRGKLIIDGVDVKIDGKSHTDMDFWGRIRKEARSGSTLNISVKIKNIFGKGEGLEIEDVIVTTTLEDIDDGNDIKIRSEEFDVLHAGAH